MGDKINSRFKSNKTFSDTKPRVGSRKLVRPSDAVEFLKMPDNEFVQMRLVGPTYSYGLHWFEVKSEKKGKSNFAKPCLGYSHETETSDPSKCPYCKAGFKISVDYISNAIIRDIQDDYEHKPKKWTEKEQETGFKEKDSKSKTPVRVVRFTANTAERLSKRSQANKVKDKKGRPTAYPLSHEENGRDINYLYNSKGTGTGKYELEVKDLTPLTEEESSYLLWDIESCASDVETKEEAQRELDGLLERNPELAKAHKSKNTSDNSDGDTKMAKSKKAAASSSASSASASSDVEVKKKKGKKAAASSSASSASSAASSSASSDAKGKKAKATKGKAKKAASSSASSASSASASASSDAKGKKAKATKGKAAKGKKAASSSSLSDVNSASDEGKGKKGKAAKTKAPKGKGKKAASSSASSASSSSMASSD